MLALAIVFWLCIGLILWTQLGYALALALVARLRGAAARRPEHVLHGAPPSLSVIVAAHDEQSVIAAKVANVLGLDYPRELLEVVVACDGCGDGPPSWLARPARTS